MFFLLVVQSEVAYTQETAARAYDPPLFRAVEDAPRPEIPENLPVRLIADADFAPYSFLTSTGAPAGLAVELAIAETEPGIQGDRVSGARKPATLETGKVIQVPLFINIGDRVKVDTRSGDYITRV